MTIASAEASDGSATARAETVARARAIFFMHDPPLFNAKREHAIVSYVPEM
jgi:hypothetical protein